MKKKASILAGVGLALGLVFGAPAAAMADPYAPIPGSQTQTVAPGGTVTFTAAGFLPGEVVVITFPDSFTLAASTTVTADSAGVVTATFTTGTSAGTFNVVFTGATSGAITFTVAVDPALAFTGTPDMTPYLWIGGGALALGIAAVVTVAVVRRERTSLPTA